MVSSVTNWSFRQISAVCCPSFMYVDLQVYNSGDYYQQIRERDRKRCAFAII